MSDSTPVVSVCIANYNGAQLIDACIESVRAQIGGISLEILVHDDASTDGSVALIRQRHPDIRVLASDTNVGYCVSNNRLVAQARGEYVLLLNNDAELFRDAVQTMVGQLRAVGGCGLASLPQFDWLTGKLVDRGCRLDFSYAPAPIRARGQGPAAYAIAACLMVPRGFWVAIGGFPEWIESIGEDIYLCCRARLAGWPILVADRSGYWHRQGASFGGSNAAANALVTTYRRRYLSEANRTLLVLECTPTAVAWLLFAVNLARLAIEGAVATLLLRSPAIWTRIYGRALGKVRAQCVGAVARRRDVQAARVVGLRNYFSAFVWIPRALALLIRRGLPKVS